MGPKNLFHIANYSILAFSILTTINKKKIKERNLGLAIVIPYCRDFLIRGYDITGAKCILLKALLTYKDLTQQREGRQGQRGRREG